ncbi:MAG TPA: cytochrome c1 [Burkholderiales bacterium]|nr:cytochrome c1 [Burkholderiales bacterium]
MREILTTLALVSAVFTPVYAAEDNVKLDPVEVDVNDAASLQSGARTFVNYCLNCHSASLVRYDQLRVLGLSDKQITDNLMFTAEKIGDPMNVAFPKKDAKAAFGVVPPDLSVIARSRSPDWLYTYLRGFYRDPGTVTGWNNTVYPNVAMPHVLWSLQGERELVKVPAMRDGKQIMEHGHPKTDSKLQTISEGTLSPSEYDRTVRDLVNFLVWIGEPHQVKRQQIGVWVVIGLVFLIALTFLLKNAYWKDVH